MRVAEILSDLTSLRVCDSAAALVLVSARPQDEIERKSNGLTTATTLPEKQTDVDLQRASDLLDLHSSVKLAHRDGLDRELLEARRQVQMILNEL